MSNKHLRLEGRVLEVGGKKVTIVTDDSDLERRLYILSLGKPLEVGDEVLLKVEPSRRRNQRYKPYFRDDRLKVAVYVKKQNDGVSEYPHRGYATISCGDFYGN